MLDILIREASIVDGTGHPAYRADIGVEADRIAVIGNLQEATSAITIEARGKVVAPGFIDVHQHSDFTPLVNRQCESAVRQGITTVVIGNCGHGCAPVVDSKLLPLTLLGYRPEWGVPIDWQSYGEYLDRLRSPGVAVNFYPLLAHGVVRMAVMGFERRSATPDELQSMGRLVARAMEEGAAGLSTGLEYSPGIHADRMELRELAKIVGRYGGLYASHIRNRADTFVDAVEEALDIGKVSGLSVQLSHLAPRPYAPAGVFDEVMDLVYRARERGMEILIDSFPDTFGPGPLAALLPSQICEGLPTQVMRRLTSKAVREEVKAAFSQPTNYLLRGAGAKQIFLTYVPEQAHLANQSLAAAADLNEESVYGLVCDLLLAAGDNFYNVFLEHLYAVENDLRHLMREPLCALASDGIITAPYGLLKDFTFNSSSYSYTARVLEQYVRQEQFYTLEDAVYRMTALPARSLGLTRRGQLQESYMADLVIFDPHTVHDNTSRQHPNRYPDGIETVIINGAITVHMGEHTGKLDGRILGRTDT